MLQRQQAEAIIACLLYTSPHGTSAYLAPIACAIDAVIEKIPGVRNIDISADSLQEKVGVLAEPVVIGGILGCLLYTS